MRPTTTGLAHTTAHHQHIDNATIIHVHVIPMVHGCADNDHCPTFGLIRGISKFMSNFDNLGTRNPGDFLLPSRGTWNVIIKAGSNIVTTQTTIKTIVRHHQIIDSSNDEVFPFCAFNSLSRNVFDQHLIVTTSGPVLIGSIGRKVWK